MSANKPKRPSSARRHVTQETFSTFVSLGRLRNIQSLLSRPSPNSNKPDSLLCVLGIDGRYNDGTRELINYLLFGFFNVRKNELERSGFAEEIIDDMIFYIRHESVDVYCNPINYNYLLPYIAHWKNLRIHCLSDQQYDDDEDLAEDFKIESFMSMVAGSYTVGIPFRGVGQQIVFDKMTVEKWPIVQAYAVEGVGGGTFFTMKYDVCDLSDPIHSVCNHMDPVAVETLVTEQLPLFERQWNNMLSVCDMQRCEEMSGLTEGRVCEPLSSYFSHGRVVTAKGCRSQPIRHPFVLFGTHTSRTHLEEAHRSGISFNSGVESAGLDGKPAHHMICQAVSPRGPLCCTRTYFFDTPVQPLPMIKSDLNLRNPSLKMTDARLLQEIYIAVVSAVLHAIDLYSMTLLADKSEDFARQTLQDECRKADVPLNPDIFRNKKYVEFHLSGYDNQNRPVIQDGVEPSPHVKTLSITVYDIPSVEHSGYVLGSVSYAESFLESSFNVLYPDGSRELNGDCTVLTSSVPRFITWPLYDRSAKVVRILRELIQRDEVNLLGKKLVHQEAAHVLSDTLNTIIIRSGELTIYEHGIVFLHPHMGALVLPKHEMSAIHFHDGDSPSVTALLILSYKEHVRYYLPPHLKNDSYRLIVAFQPKSKAYKALFSTVLPSWKLVDERPELEVLDDLPQELLSVHSLLQQEYDLQTVLPSSVSSLKRVECKLPDLHGFLRHLSVSSVGRAPICSKHLAAVLDKPYDAGSFDCSDELIVTIIGGVPGSHKHDLCTSLTKLAKDDSRWAIIKQTITSADPFNPVKLQASLSATWRTQHRRKPGQSSKKMRAIVVTSGFTDIIDVIQAIVSHPDTEVSRHIKIGCVTVCVDSANSFMENTATLPTLLDSCSQGWVNVILYSGSYASQKSEELETLQKLIRAVNSDVAFLLASNADVTRSPDLDLMLSETLFDQDTLIRARYLSSPGWWLGKFVCGRRMPEIMELSLYTSQPLERRKLVQQLKSLKLKHQSAPFHGNIYEVRGKVTFAESAQQYELRYVVLSGSLTLIPAELQPTPPSSVSNGLSHACIIVFTGCQLEESMLQNWLRTCARQKMEKKLKRSVTNLNKSEINRIHKLHHLDSLPEGWFYNGSHFVSLDGSKSDTHPDLADFLCSHVEDLNLEVCEHNRHVELEDYHDLFE